MTSSAVTRSTDRRLLGQRGMQTRQKLMDAAIGQLGFGSYRNITVSDIAREVGTSSATFYQYFAEIEDIVLEVAGPLSEETRTAVAPFKDGWFSDGLPGTTRLVDAVLGVWATHHAALRVLAIVAAERDPRFDAAYAIVTRPVIRVLTSALGLKSHGPVHRALVDNLVTVLAAAAGHEGTGNLGGLSMKQRRTGLAHVIHATLTNAAH